MDSAINKQTSDAHTIIIHSSSPPLTWRYNSTSSSICCYIFNALPALRVSYTSLGNIGVARQYRSVHALAGITSLPPLSTLQVEVQRPKRIPRLRSPLLRRHLAWRGCRCPQGFRWRRRNISHLHAVSLPHGSNDARYQSGALMMPT